MRQKFSMNRQGFPPRALGYAAPGNSFPLHKLPEMRPLPVVPIFDHRFLCSLLLEIGPLRIGSIFRHPRQAHWLLEIEPMHCGSISQRISPCRRASKIGPLRNVPIFSLKHATNFRPIHMNLPRRASNYRPRAAKRPPGACHPSVFIARSL